MDKIYYTNNDVNSQQGFALMITLSVLSVIIALTMVLLSYFEEVQNDAGKTKALIQADLYYADIGKIFGNFENKKILFSMLYQSAFPLESEDGAFSLLLHCEPLSGGVNINWLGLESDAKNQEKIDLAHELFEMLVQEYDIENAGRLLELLYEEMGAKNRLGGQNQRRLHQKNGIISYKQFTNILNNYQFEVDDSEIGRVPWEKHFSFYLKSDKVDIEYSSAELISYLFTVELSATREWVSSLEKEPLEVFVRTNAGDYAGRKSLLVGKEFLEETQCSVRYVVDGVYYRFRFEYIEGGAKHFEFYGKE